MPDTYDTKTRSEVMKRVKGRDTKPELLLRKTMFSLGLRGWRCHRSDLPGQPDVTFGKLRLTVFVDGAFWHGHPSKYWRGRSGAYWDNKIARNIQRDQDVNNRLTSEGWNIIRLWDFEVLADPYRAATRVKDALERIRSGAQVVIVHPGVLADRPPLQEEP